MKRELPFDSKILIGRLRWVLLVVIMVQIPQITFSQSPITVTGNVTSQVDGKPIPGVSIVVKNTSTGTTTDVDGNYSLVAPPDATLVFTFIGFAGEEVNVNSRQVIDVTMTTDIQTLEEVVVTGYSTQRRKDITGSVSIVDVEEFRSVPSFSAEQALQGMASGVNVIRSGVPGASSKIFIRGITSFGDTDPLVIVDGIQQDLNNISAKDIESIQVLKDAGSAAIYGVRGANGVILVTTKKGKAGAPVITYEASYGMQYPRAGNPYNLLDPEGYMQVFNQAYPGNSKFANGMPDYTYMGPAGSGVAFDGDPEVDPSLYFLETPNVGRNYVIYKVNKKGTDWFHELYKPAPTTEHNLSASGGTDRGTYRFSLGYLNQQGTLIKSYLKRYSARVNTEFQIGEHIRIGENINLIYRDIGGVYGSTAPYGLQAMIPVKDIMGNWAGSFGGPSLGQMGSPVAAQYRHENDINNEWHIVGNGYAEVDFLKNFTARTSIGYNITNTYEHTFSPTPYETSESNNALNRLSLSSGYGSMMTFTNSLNYRKAFDKHNVAVLIGSEAISYNARSQNGRQQNFFSTDPDFQVLDNGQEGAQNSSTINKHNLFSVFSRVDYAYADKYLIAVTARRDGSSRFGPGKKYGIFPSVSVGWRMSEEPFMQALSWIDDFKLRGSYGVLGSQNNVDPQNQYDLFYSGRGYPDAANHYYDLAGTGNSAMQGFGIQRFGNINTGWEENIISNYGFDATLLNNRLNLSLEFYKKSIKGLLFTEPLPAVLGDADAPQINIGNIENAGLDLTAGFRGMISSSLRYSVATNITTYKNEIVNIPGPGYFDAGVVRNKEGYPVSSFFGYKVLGLFDSDQEVAASPAQDGAAPGRFRYQDSDGDGVITPDDRIHLGHPNPDFTYGFNLGLEFKNFDFSAFLYGSQGNEIYSSIRRGLDFLGYYPHWNKSRVLLNAWTPENTNTDIPKVESTASFSTSNVTNSYYIENGSFLKLRSVMLGYTVNPGLLSRIKISQLRLYAQVANPVTISKYSGIDPEVGGSSAAFGVDGGRYPTDETNLTFGLSVRF